MRILSKLRFLMVFFLISFCSCLPLTPEIKDYSPVYPQQIITSPDEILTILQKKLEAFQDLKGLAEIEINLNGEIKKSKETIVIKKPLCFRIEVLNMFGLPVMFIVSDGVTLSKYIPDEKKIFWGALSRENIISLLGFDLALSARDITAVFSGNVPLLAEYEEMSLNYLGKTKGYLLEISSAKKGIKQKIWLDSANFSIKKSEIFNSQGNILLQVILDGAIINNRYRLPSKIEISSFLTGTKAKITYKKIKINTGVSEDLFRLQVPSKTKRIKLN